MLHGHAVATGMGFGAYLSRILNWISEDEFLRVLNLISVMELALWHPIMEDVDMIWSSQVKMIQKRGGHLCAPIPKQGLGKCGYLNELSYEDLKSRYKAHLLILFWITHPTRRSWVHYRKEKGCGLVLTLSSRYSVISCIVHARAHF